MDYNLICDQAHAILSALGEKVYMLVPNDDPNATSGFTIAKHFTAFKGFGIEINSLRNLCIEHEGQIVFENQAATQTGTWETAFTNLHDKLPELIRLRHLRDGIIEALPIIQPYNEYHVEILDDPYGKRVQFYWRKKPKLFHSATHQLVFDYDYDTFPLIKGEWYDFVSQQIISKHRAKLPLT